MAQSGALVDQTPIHCGCVSQPGIETFEQHRILRSASKSSSTRAFVPSPRTLKNPISKGGSATELVHTKSISCSQPLPTVHPLVISSREHRRPPVSKHPNSASANVSLDRHSESDATSDKDHTAQPGFCIHPGKTVSLQQRTACSSVTATITSPPPSLSEHVEFKTSPHTTYTRSSGNGLVVGGLLIVEISVGGELVSSPGEISVGGELFSSPPSSKYARVLDQISCPSKLHPVPIVQPNCISALVQSLPPAASQISAAAANDPLEHSGTFALDHTPVHCG